MVSLVNVQRAVLASLVVLGFLSSKVDSLTCRNGIENSVAYVFWEKTCDKNQTACFQSVKCEKIGDTDFIDYEWRCIDGSKCSNATGVSLATHDNIKGTCCFKDNCNAFKGKCTDAGGNLVANWMSLAIAMLLVYHFV